jgi:hypothetical protein
MNQPVREQFRTATLSKVYMKFNDHKMQPLIFRFQEKGRRIAPIPTQVSAALTREILFEPERAKAADAEYGAFG